MHSKDTGNDGHKRTPMAQQSVRPPNTRPPLRPTRTRGLTGCAHTRTRTCQASAVVQELITAGKINPQAPVPTPTPAHAQAYASSATAEATMSSLPKEITHGPTESYVSAEFKTSAEDVRGAFQAGTGARAGAGTGQGWGPGGDRTGTGSGRLGRHSKSGPPAHLDPPALPPARPLPTRAPVR